ncbi:MAG: Trm112 family protein [Terracidiphilus sp.]|jgi:uncharacterized protein YbaR (Trm112 family)
MPENFHKLCTFDASVVDQLACPACLGGLGLDESKLVCARCGRSYPIVDGIPVLIAGREENPRE